MVQKTITNTFSFGLALKKLFLPDTQHAVKTKNHRNQGRTDEKKSIFCFSHQVTYPEGITKCKKASSHSHAWAPLINSFFILIGL